MNEQSTLPFMRLVFTQLAKYKFYDSLSSFASHVALDDIVSDRVSSHHSFLLFIQTYDVIAWNSLPLIIVVSLYVQ